jgi:hypothetical protein
VRSKGNVIFSGLKNAVYCSSCVLFGSKASRDKTFVSTPIVNGSKASRDKTFVSTPIVFTNQWWRKFVRYDFILSIVVYSHISQTNVPITAMLQSIPSDLIEAWMNVKHWFNILRQNAISVYNTLYGGAVDLAVQFGVVSSKPRTADREWNRANPQV